ncbi:MAG: ABC transporter permease, partial [Pseudomonadota bacterium]
MVFTRFEWSVAMRYLRARRQEGFISVIAWFSLLGIALGVATLIIVMSVMNGFRHELLSRILGLNGHLGVYGLAQPLANFDAVAVAVRKVPGVVSATPIVEGQVMATARGMARGALVRGIRAEDLASGHSLVARSIVGGGLARFTGDDAVVIGSRLAERLGVGIGDRVTLISPQGTATALGTVPRMRAYQVVATFNIGMFEYDSSYVFMPLEAAQIYFRLPGAVTNLEVFVVDPDDAPRIGARISGALQGQVRIHDWQQANASFFTAIQVERNVMFLILPLIILVAAFN